MLDGRTTNHMDPETKAVHVRLEAWGKTCADRWRAWPEKTLLWKISKWGPEAAAAHDKVYEHIPADLAAVDAAISKLGEIDKQVVVNYYTRQEPPEAVARRLRMRLRQFQNVLRRARWRVGGYLMALEN